MAAAEASVILVRVCRQLIALKAVIILLLITDVQCKFFVADSGTGDLSRTLQVESQQPGRNSKSIGADAKFNFDAVGPRFPKHLSNLGRNGLTRRRILTTGHHANARSRLQVEALTTFKAAITNDPHGALESWHANDSDACGWAGVVCSLKHPKNLIALNLNGAELVGNINSALQEVGNLRFLKRLDLSSNAFTGSIPAASLANCSNLYSLNFSHNQLSGNIPSQVGEMVNLQTIDFGGNNLTGEIPIALGNCTSLKFLDLGSNFLEGAIPPVLGRLGRLQSLRLGKNSLSGSVPAALGNCSSLANLALFSNSNLGGELPRELSQLKSLQQLDLSTCSFKGALPTWMGNLTTLIVINLSYNYLDGQIPDWMGQLQDLGMLALGHNNVTGAVPISIMNCTKLTIFSVESNSLTGNIPPQIGFLRTLKVLYLWGNSFTGVIPSSMANCSALQSLQLGENALLDSQAIPSWIGSLPDLYDLYLPQMNLQGPIPSEIGKLSNLQSLALFSNNLTGLLPAWFANCTLLRVLDLAKNQLSGEIPSEIGLLANLTWLALGENVLTGAFPAFISNLTQIERLTVEFNSLNGRMDDVFGRLSELQEFVADANYGLSGPIPETLSNCSKLYALVLSGNSLSGKIPPSFGNMTALEQLSFGDNDIDGNIPKDLMRCYKLGFLELGGNNLEGSIPSNIGQLSSLRNLYLNNNKLTGRVPASLGSCYDMMILDLSYNKLVGSVPGDILSAMSFSLVSLNLSHNSFSGSWPVQLSELANVQEIDVSANNISGSIPTSIGSCKALVRLDVSINNLTGPLPQALASLATLSFFNASYNNFQGPIPESGIFKANLTETSFLGNPGLCGIILGPYRQCHNSSVTVSISESCHGFGCKIVWIPATCALIGAVLIGVGVVLCWMYTSYAAAKKRMNGNVSGHLVVLNHVMRFTEKDVLRIMEGDHGENNVIGVGANSVVYKGVIPGVGMFAVKVLRNSESSAREDGDGSRRVNELLQEVHMLAKLSHRNILKVLSFCSTADVKAIILEYMPQGSLHRHLHELRRDGCDLTWQNRFNIATGVAEAMVYLHHDFSEPLIHRDLKPGNILLDENLEPKVADFGLSKFARDLDPDGDPSTTFCGTFGYMPPEHAMGSTVSTKGDVYSYGMVLMELLTGREPTRTDGPSAGKNLKDWVRGVFQDSRPFELLDPTLKEEAMRDSIKQEQMMLVMRVAIICTRDTPHKRPSMREVLAMLSEIKEVGLGLAPPRTLGDLVNSEITIVSSTESDY